MTTNSSSTLPSRRGSDLVRRLLRAGALALALVATPVASSAQDFGLVQSPILTIDQERLYVDSAYGKRVRELIAEESTELAAENRRIEAQLIAEEQALTDQRAALPAEEFRALADAFDEKVQQIRAEQDAKARDLSRRDDNARQRFLRQIVGILGELVRERGAVAIIERRSIFLAADSIDITDAAIARIDAVLGQGDLTPPAAEPAPEPAPPPPEDTEAVE